MCNNIGFLSVNLYNPARHWKMFRLTTEWPTVPFLKKLFYLLCCICKNVKGGRNSVWGIVARRECLSRAIFSWRSWWGWRLLIVSELCQKVELQSWLYLIIDYTVIFPHCPCLTWYFSLLQTHRALCRFSSPAPFIPMTWLTLMDIPVLSLSCLSSRISQNKIQ